MICVCITGGTAIGHGIGVGGRGYDGFVRVRANKKYKKKRDRKTKKTEGPEERQKNKQILG